MNRSDPNNAWSGCAIGLAAAVAAWIYLTVAFALNLPPFR